MYCTWTLPNIQIQRLEQSHNVCVVFSHSVGFKTLAAKTIKMQPLLKSITLTLVSRSGSQSTKKYPQSLPSVFLAAVVSVFGLVIAGKRSNPTEPAHCASPVQTPTTHMCSTREEEREPIRAESQVGVVCVHVCTCVRNLR